MKNKYLYLFGVIYSISIFAILNLTACTSNVSEDVPWVNATLRLIDEDIKIYVGDTVSIRHEVTGDDIIWESSDPFVARVKDGVIYAINEGRAIITATLMHNPTKKEICTVTISKVINIDRIVLNETSMSLITGDTIKIIASIYPSNATYNDLKWISLSMLNSKYFDHYL